MVTEPHRTRRVLVRLSAESKIADRKAGAFEFSLTMTAPDPLRYSYGLNASSCPLPSSSGGVAFPLSFPLNFGSGSSGGRTAPGERGHRTHLAGLADRRAVCAAGDHQHLHR